MEGQLLVMLEDLRPHVAFHLRSHDVTVIGLIKVTEGFQNHKPQHQHRQFQDHRQRIFQVNHMICDIADNQRYHQRNPGADHCHHHIRPE